jgi:hypothetical protein
MPGTGRSKDGVTIGYTADSGSSRKGGGAQPQLQFWNRLYFIIKTLPKPVCFLEEPPGYLRRELLYRYEYVAASVIRPAAIGT